MIKNTSNSKQKLSSLAHNKKQANSFSEQLAKSHKITALFGREIFIQKIVGSYSLSTGKVDKNENPIFDGHIIREYDDKGEHCDFLVFYNKEECAYMAHLIAPDNYGAYHMGSFDSNTIEIIGHHLEDRALIKNFDMNFLGEKAINLEQIDLSRKAA